MSAYNVLTWPDFLLPDKWSWGMRRLDTSMPVPFNNAPPQVLRRGGLWLCDMEWDDVGPDESQPLGALLAQLEDKSNVILVRDYGYQIKGAGGGAPTFQGLGADTNHILTAGWTPNTTVLAAGDMFQLANMRLLQVQATATVTSDGTGAATIPSVPELRAQPAVGSAITLTDPSCYMQLTGNKFTRAVERPSKSSLRVSMQEVKIT